jgi:hypothetical protein
VRNSVGKIFKYVCDKIMSCNCLLLTSLLHLTSFHVSTQPKDLPEADSRLYVFVQRVMFTGISAEFDDRLLCFVTPFSLVDSNVRDACLNKSDGVRSRKTAVVIVTEIVTFEEWWRTQTHERLRTVRT